VGFGRANVLLPAVLALILAPPARAAEGLPPVTDGSGPFRHVLHLAGSIGPRKNGTAAERRAIEYIAHEMESAGLTVTRQEVIVARYDEGERAVGSWNIIGELAGASRDTIVLGAHHDSRSVTVPGANDDASGVAVLLEVARLAARRAHRLTYRFISFCAEEEGLLGSRDYVQKNDLSPVRAMIALELVGRGELVVGPVPVPPARWAQELLLRAARESGARGVMARPIWSIAPRILGLPFSADHEPFLDRKVPSFLVLGTFPGWAYHTSEDGVSGVRPEALENTVRVVDRILQDLETRPLDRADDPHYLPMVLFGRDVLLPSEATALVSITALLACGLLALRRLAAVAHPRAIGLTLRVVLVTGTATALGLFGMVLSELAMECFHRVLYPWMAHQGMHVAQGIAWTLVTSWLGLKLFRRIKPTVEPGPYLAAALLIPVVWMGLALREGFPEVAVLMAAPALLFLASLLFESTGRKLALGFAAALPFTWVLALRDYRTLVDLGGVSPPIGLLFGFAFVMVFPFVLFLAHVASFQSCLHSRVWWWLSGRRVGVACLAVSALLFGVNLFLPSYDYRHRPIVRVRQRVELNAGRAVATIRSQERLRGVRLSGEGARSLDPEGTTDRVVLPFPSDRFGFSAVVEPGGPGEVKVGTRLTAPFATDRLSYVFNSRAGFRVPGRGEDLRHSYTFTETAPQEDPVGDFRLLVPEGADLAVDLRAEFVEDLLRLDPVSDGPSVFVHQASIEGSRQLLGPGRAVEGPPPDKASSPR
jgi:hypothetical protein